MKKAITLSMAIVATSILTVKAADTFPALVSLGQTYSGTIEQTVENQESTLRCADKYFNFDNSANTFETGAEYVVEFSISGCADWKQVAFQTDLDAWDWHDIWNSDGIATGTFKDTITAKSGLTEQIGFKIVPWDLAEGKSATVGSTFATTITGFKITKLGEGGGGSSETANTHFDFEDKNINDTYGMRTWNAGDGTSTVVANPAGSGKVVNVVTSNYNAVLQLPITLPSGATIADVKALSFDIYIPTNANDENPNYKNLIVYINGGEPAFEESGYGLVADIATWTKKTIQFSELTIADKSLTSFNIAFGMNVEKGNYYIDNMAIELTNGGSGNTETANTHFDFEDKNINDTYGMRTWNAGDGSATVVANPAGSGKVVNIVTSNYNAVLQLPITLPSGATIADVKALSFDIYIPTNANDENPNYKNLIVYINGGEPAFEESGYGLVADIATWTKKTIQFSELTIADKSLTSFNIAFGMNVEKGNYYIDNVAIELVGSAVNTINAAEVMKFAHNSLTINELGDVMVFSVDGRTILAKQQVKTLDLSHLAKGIYIVKANINNQTYTLKISK